MTNGAKIALASVAAFVVAIGTELIYIHHKRVVEENAPPPAAYQAAARPTVSDDEAALFSLHKEHPDSLKDERKWIGKTLWVSAGDQLEYYKDAGKHVDYSKPVGILKGADPLVVKDVFEQAAPKSGRAVFRVAPGVRHVLLAFTLPKSDNPSQLYATPVGNYDGQIYSFITDDVFFYEDPHTLFHWTPDVWAHVEKHECALGMSEYQCMLALGQTIDPHGDKAGDRSVTFHNDEHPVTVEFRGDKAVKVTPGS